MIYFFIRLLFIGAEATKSKYVIIRKLQRLNPMSSNEWYKIIGAKLELISESKSLQNAISSKVQTNVNTMYSC